jgi:hypothetical protein
MTAANTTDPQDAEPRPDRQENTMNEPFEDRGVERGAAEEASGTPLTPTEEEASSRPPSDPEAQDDDTPGGGTARPEDLNPDDLE